MRKKISSNPIGTHPSERIDKDPNGSPNNMTPYITQTANDLRKKLDRKAKYGIEEMCRDF